MRIADHDMLDEILNRLGAVDAMQVELMPAGKLHATTKLYRVSHGAEWAYVNRSLAVRLRERGARWTADLRLDPCAVA